LEKDKMNHRERLEACISGDEVDRPPVALWRHFPVDDQSPARLAEATINFQKTYDFDLVKVTPASSFCTKDLGVSDEGRGASEGTREYTVHAIHEAEDWLKLPVLDPNKGYLGAQLESLRRIVRELGPEVPVIQTIFNPLSQAKYLVGKDMLLVHLRQAPEAVHTGLQTITASTQRYIDAVVDCGVDGIFFAVQHAQYGLMSKEEYLEFGKAYDLQVLKRSEKLWLNMLHLHGEHVMFDLVAGYPVDVINWHDQDTFPSLAKGKELYSGVVCGGLKREQSMVLGTPESVTAEAKAAIAATAGERFILGTGCVVPITAPRANLLAARMSVEI
jgi:uroporphyrinogen decarboxylase